MLDSVDMILWVVGYETSGRDIPPPPSSRSLAKGARGAVYGEWDCVRRFKLAESDMVINRRPGILVLIHDTDSELEGEGEYLLQDGDEIVLISTLHGG